jgi:hypothetical protein
MESSSSISYSSPAVNAAARSRKRQRLTKAALLILGCGTLSLVSAVLLYEHWASHLAQTKSWLRSHDLRAGAELTRINIYGHGLDLISDDMLLLRYLSSGLRASRDHALPARGSMGYEITMRLKGGDDIQCEVYINYTELVLVGGGDLNSRPEFLRLPVGRSAPPQLLELVTNAMRAQR